MDSSATQPILRRSLIAAVIHDLDVVSVRTEDERGVIAGVVARALARSAVAVIAGARGELMEPLHVCVVTGGKRHVQIFGGVSGEQRGRPGRAAVLHSL